MKINHFLAKTAVAAVLAMSGVAQAQVLGGGVSGGLGGSITGGLGNGGLGNIGATGSGAADVLGNMLLIPCPRLLSSALFLVLFVGLNKLVA